MPRKKKTDVLGEAIAQEKAALTELQRGAQEMLERQAAAQAALPAEDQPSGVVLGTDWNFMKHDSLDATHYLDAHGIEKNPEVEYRFVNTDRRVVDRKLHKGWSPVAGGKVRHGDLMVCQRSKAACEAERAQIRELTRMREGAPMQAFEGEATREGVPVLDK